MAFIGLPWPKKAAGIGAEAMPSGLPDLAAVVLCRVSGHMRTSRDRERAAPPAPLAGGRYPPRMYPGKHAVERPDDPAFIMASTGETVTFGEYEARANRLAHLFREAGLRRTDHIAILMENNPRMLECEGRSEERRVGKER